MVRDDRLDALDFHDTEFVASVTAFLHRHLDVLLAYRIVRTCNALMREASLADVLRLAGMLANDTLRELIRSILRQGPGLDGSRARDLFAGLHRSHLETIVIYLELERLRRQDDEFEIYVQGRRFGAAEGAVDLGRRFFAAVTGDGTTESSLASLFSSLLREHATRLARINPLAVFLALLDDVVIIDRPGESGSGRQRAFRTVLLERLRRAIPDPGRLPLAAEDPISFRDGIDRDAIIAGNLPAWFLEASPGDDRSPLDYFLQRSIASLGNGSSATSDLATGRHDAAGCHHTAGRHDTAAAAASTDEGLPLRLSRLQLLDDRRLRRLVPQLRTGATKVSSVLAIAPVTTARRGGGPGPFVHAGPADDEARRGE